jgi:hypothetical protein
VYGPVPPVAAALEARIVDCPASVRDNAPAAKAMIYFLSSKEF